MPREVQRRRAAQRIGLGLCACVALGCERGGPGVTEAATPRAHVTVHRATADAAISGAAIEAGSSDAGATKADASDAGAHGDAGVLGGIKRTTFSAYPDASFPPENPFDANKAVLGKILFWDEQLSADDTVACGTCHRPSAGGADPRPSQPGYLGHPGPDGVRGSADDPRGSPGIARCMRAADGKAQSASDPLFGSAVQVTRRRSMSFVDAMFWPALFWDGRASDVLVDPEQPDHTLIARGAALETQALGPLQNPVEMTCSQSTWSDLTGKLAARAPLARARSLPLDIARTLAAFSDYPALFSAAFASSDITPARIAMAIATYERTLASRETPWDRWRGGDDAALTATELRGFSVFAQKAGCACCHAPPLFGAALYLNDGFSRSIWDQGREEVTHDPKHAGAFRIPSLRNVALREHAGLLHDGVAPGQSLESLLDAYAKPPLQGGSSGFCIRRGFALEPDERSALLEFLRHGLTDPRMRAETPPFDRPKLGSEVEPVTALPAP